MTVTIGNYENQKPELWGPAAWALIHWAASQEQRKEEFFAFVGQFRSFLPCKVCRRHFRMHWSQLNDSCKGSISKWAFSLHNRVRSMKNQSLYTERAYRKDIRQYRGKTMPLIAWRFLYSVSITRRGNNTRSIFWKRLIALCGDYWAHVQPLENEKAIDWLYRCNKMIDSEALPPLVHLEHILACSEACA